MQGLEKQFVYVIYSNKHFNVRCLADEGKALKELDLLNGLESNGPRYYCNTFSFYAERDEKVRRVYIVFYRHDIWCNISCWASEEDAKKEVEILNHYYTKKWVGYCNNSCSYQAMDVIY